MNRLVVTFALLLTTSATARSEDRPPAKTDDATVTVRQVDDSKFPEITLEFEVKAADGTPILEAGRDEFRVTEDGRPVDVVGFRSPVSREFRPTTVVLVLDRSSSMLQGDRIGGLKRAVSAFLDAQPKGSRVAVVAFGSEVELICPFTDDPDRVRATVGEMFPNGNTVFYDAVEQAIRLLAEQSGRRAILAMTDGEDNISLHATLDSVIRSAQRAGFPVHTLGLGTEGRPEADALRALAEETRGRALSAHDPESLRSIFEEVARSLGETYTATYRSDRPIQDGTLRPIVVAYAKSRNVGEQAVFVRGMVVPSAGWSPLFLSLILGLGVLLAVPSLRSRGST